MIIHAHVFCKRQITFGMLWLVLVFIFTDFFTDLFIFMTFEIHASFVHNVQSHAVFCIWTVSFEKSVYRFILASSLIPLTTRKTLLVLCCSTLRCARPCYVSSPRQKTCSYSLIRRWQHCATTSNLHCQESRAGRRRQLLQSPLQPWHSWWKATEPACSSVDMRLETPARM